MILLRLIPTAVHTFQDIDQTINAFSSISGKLKNGDYNKEELLMPIS
jgi:glycine C-acetyltransferase